MRGRWPIRNQTPLLRAHALECCLVQPEAGNNAVTLVRVPGHRIVVGSEQKMIEIAGKVIIVADRTKFGRGGMIPVAPLNAADIVISDRDLAPGYVDLLTRSGVEVLLA